MSELKSLAARALFVNSAHLSTMARSDRTLRRWYRFINHKFFYDELPNNVVVQYDDQSDVEFDADHNYATVEKGVGRNSYIITISRQSHTGINQVLISLIHEMIHIATGMKDDHGPKFEEWRQTLGDRGIFKKGVIRRGLTLL